MNRHIPCFCALLGKENILYEFRWFPRRRDPSQNGIHWQERWFLWVQIISLKVGPRKEDNWIAFTESVPIHLKELKRLIATDVTIYVLLLRNSHLYFFASSFEPLATWYDSCYSWNMSTYLTYISSQNWNQFSINFLVTRINFPISSSFSFLDVWKFNKAMHLKF